MEQKRLNLRGWLLLLALALVWGGSFTANKAALAEFPVPSVVAFRVGLGAVALWLYIRARGLPVPRDARFLVTCAVLGLTNNLIPFGLIVWGQTHVASGLAGILNATTALTTAVIASLVFPDEKLTPPRLIGLGFGLAGVIGIVGPGALTHLDLTSAGQLAILGAALSYGVASVYGRRRLQGIRPEVSAAGMLTAAALVAVPLALAVGGVPHFRLDAALAGLVYLALVSSAFAYLLFYTVLAEAGASNIGLVTLLVAPAAVLFGWAAFGEALPVEAVVGLVLLTLGLLIMDERLVPGRYRSRRKA